MEPYDAEKLSGGDLDGSKPRTASDFFFENCSLGKGDGPGMPVKDKRWGIGEGKCGRIFFVSYQRGTLRICFSPPIEKGSKQKHNRKGPMLTLEAQLPLLFAPIIEMSGSLWIVDSHAAEKLVQLSVAALP